MKNKIVKRNNIKIIGEGEVPLLFAHGFGCDQNMWRFVTPVFERDFTIILFDYVGSGNSDISAYNSERYKTLEGYALDVLDIVHALDLEEVIFIGHSVSSMIGALASISQPDRFGKLIMIGPSPSYLNDPPDYYGGYEKDTIVELLSLMEKNYIGWANFFAPEIMKNEDRPELAKELEESFCSTDPVIAQDFAKATFLADNRDELPEVDVPSLIIQSKDDSIAPLNVGEYLHKHLKNSTLRVIPVNGHCPHLSHPELTSAAIKNYIENSTSK